MSSPVTCREFLLQVDLALALIVKARCAERDAGGRTKGQGKGRESEKRLSVPTGVAKGPRRRRMIEPCGRARVRTATGTSCSRSQGRPRRTVVPSPSEDPVPFIEIRRIDCRDCARALILSLSLLTARPLDGCENMFKRDCSVILGRSYFGGLFKPSKCDLCPSCYKNCNDKIGRAHV